MFIDYKTYAYVLNSPGIHVTTSSKFMRNSNPMINLQNHTQVLDEEIDKFVAFLKNFLEIAV